MAGRIGLEGLESFAADLALLICIGHILIGYSQYRIAMHAEYPVHECPKQAHLFLFHTFSPL